MKKAYPKSGHLTLESMSKASWYNTWTTQIFKTYLKGDILEVGCGIGSFTKTLTSYGNVYAFDTDRTSVSLTKKAVKNAKVGFGDIEEGTYFFKKTFDTVVCINVLEHVKQDQKALSHMVSLLKPKGTLILLVPAHPMLFGDIDQAIGHYRRYTKKDIQTMLKKNKLKITYIRGINFLGALGWLISGKILHEVTVNEKKLKLFDKVAPFILPVEKVIEPPIGTSILAIAQKK